MPYALRIVRKSPAFALISILTLALGICAGLALTRFMSSLLFGISSSDPMTYIAVCVALISIATLAAFLPARRASRLDPLLSLHYE